MAALTPSRPAPQVFFSTGRYDLGSTGLQVGSCTTLAGANAGGTVLHFRGGSGSAITLLKDTSWFRLHGLTLHGSRTDGYGINGTAQYVRYFSIRDFGGALPLSTP